MPESRFSSPGQPLGVRAALRIYEGLASLKLAVVVIGFSAALLAAATLVERYFGEEAARWGVYRTWGFTLLHVLLGLNVLCAALVRFPWKRRQVGFLMTHAGILVLLVGCLLTRLGGIDGQLWVAEGGTSHRAFTRAQVFQLEVYQQQNPGANPASDPQRIAIGFAPGPLNWNEYRRWYLLPWRLADRDRGVLYNRDGVSLEVLDYCANSELAEAPPLRLKVRKRHGQPSPAPFSPGTEPWNTIELTDVRSASFQGMHARMGGSNRAELPGGPRVVFWVAGSLAETDAFRDSHPEFEPGRLGLLVVHAQGQKHSFLLDQWKPAERQSLGRSGLWLELAGLNPERGRLQLRVHAPGQSPRPMLIYADFPEMCIHDQEYGVFATYWHPGSAAQPESKSDSPAAMLRGLGGPRIDIIQGTDQGLYYRVWQPPRVEPARPLPLDGTPTVAFQGSGEAVEFYVDRFVPHDLPGRRVRPVGLEPGAPPRLVSPPRVLVRLSVDGRSEQFWLQGLEPSVFDLPPGTFERRVIFGDGRRVALGLRRHEIDLGFEVYLHRFERLLDPGSQRVSHFSSRIDLLDRGDPGAKLQENVTITLNQPVSVIDPSSRRAFRLYQESFQGPWRRDDPEFAQLAGSTSRRDERFVSILALNYDPGRGLKYAGTLLIFVGILTVYFVRTGLFRRGGIPTGTARPRLEAGPEPR
ncbi:MAG: cytochrome c biogenesis protein ResB [Thermoguttaceae bacterium]